jgi:hypothetical protein
MRLCFLDLETTSLHLSRRPWEIGIVWTDNFGQSCHNVSWMIRREDLDMANADLASLAVGRYFERHPEEDGTGRVYSMAEALQSVADLTCNATILGQNPSFDSYTLQLRMAEYGILYSAHYQTVDVTQLAVGYLAGEGRSIAPPYDTSQVSDTIGVIPNAAGLKHTAIGDAMWAYEVFFQVEKLRKESV